jgi:hypothetical protein
MSKAGFGYRIKELEWITDETELINYQNLVKGFLKKLFGKSSSSQKVVCIAKHAFTPKRNGLINMDQPLGLNY